MSNNGGVYTWSKTAALNASADTTVNYLEGQAPSSINDSARSAMASVAKYRDDISGAIVTTGISVAYVVASNQNFDTLADFHGQVIAFSPHIANGAGPVTMTVDAFANLPLRTAPGVELMTGTLSQGTPYAATYNNIDGALYLQGYYNSPYNVPFLGGMDFWDTVTPGSAFIFPIGQAISRSVYSRAFAKWGTKFGAGDGSTTFNVPDKTGRVSAMIEPVGSRLTNLNSGNSTIIGGTGGADRQAIASTNLPANIPFTGGWTFNPSFGGNTYYVGTGQGPTTASGGSGAVLPLTPTAINLNGTMSNNFAINGSGANTPLPTVPPVITCNYIIRII